MGNREDLLAGAQALPVRQGVRPHHRARRRRRPRASASPRSATTSASKEALLTAALQDAITEWGAGLAETLIAAATDLASAWTAGARVVRHAAGRCGPSSWNWSRNSGRDPGAARDQFAGSNRQARQGLVELFRSLHPDLDPADAERLGALYQTLLVGSAATWLADPDSAPAAEDLLAAMRLVTDRQDQRAPE